MICENQVSLREKTTMHIGGTARRFYTPESEQELIELVQSLSREGREFRILSGGSNVLITDQRAIDDVISMKKACMQMDHKGEGYFEIGASVRIQDAIAYVNQHGYGGFEELIGLPALIGGIVYMNAGIGGYGRERFNIGQFIASVWVWDKHEGKKVELTKGECAFGYRKSIFQQDRYVILGVVLALGPQALERSKARIEKRREYIRTHQEWGKGCFGSCFSQFCGPLLRISTCFCKKGITTAKKNANWLVNDGNGTYRQAMKFIRINQWLHRMTGRKLECEVRIWE